MRLKLTLLLLTGLLAAGCQPQIVYIVLSPTPTLESQPTEAAAVTVETTPEVNGPPTTIPATVIVPTIDTTAGAEVVIPTTVVTPFDLITSATTPPTETPAALTPSATSAPANFPTPLFQQIQVAEQLFEHGRMFWLQPTGQFWVLVVTAEGRGTWSVYEDTFQEGEAESDPSIVPPEGLLQPVRGFGKLWREVQQVRDELGWAVTPEFGYVSRYEFHAGGTINAQGTYEPQVVNAQGTAEPSRDYHILYSLYGEQFRFNTADSTWQLGGG
jgi:hypothetical protein